MKYKLASPAKHFYENDSEVLELKKLGFEFDKYDDNYFGELAIKDNDKLTITLETTKDIANFIEKFGDIIISKTFLPDDNEPELQIRIYNGYVE